MAFSPYNNPGFFGYGNFNRPQYSYGHRGGGICGSCCGMMFGIIMFFSTIYLIYWNEGYAVTTAESLAEGMKNIKILSVEDLTSTNLIKFDGQLVHISGFVDSNIITDPLFGVNIKAIKMERIVKMFQWIEKKQENRREVIDQYNGNRQIQVYHEYYHVQGWDSKFHDSSQFHSSHNGITPINPAMPYSSDMIQSKTAKIGDLKLSNEILNLMEPSISFPINEAIKLPQKYKLFNGKIQTWDSELKNPDIGDLIIEYQILPTSVLSMIGQIQAGLITSYTTSNGLPIILIEEGTYSASIMFQRVEEWNNLRTWMLRGLSLFLMFLSFRLILDPFASIFSIVPILGPFIQSIIGVGATIVAFGLAISFTFLVSSLSWFLFRPILSVSLVACALIPVFFLRQQTNNIANINQQVRAE